MADILGITLPPMPFDLISIVDSSGIEHRFNVVRQVVPKWIILKAQEITPDESSGYQFAARGNHKADIYSIFNKLMKKLEREVNARYITEHTFQGFAQNVIRGDVVKGRLEFDPHSQEEPLVVVDGKSYDWNEFGRILRQFEGFQFKLKMSDLTDD
ncbi:DUF7713 domain-containing protein [Ferroacidibacillus organovorans]|nr:hypothetical protein [Ferroacidibacillus organovorans]